MTVVAIVDPDETGRNRAQQRTGVLKACADYREMLQKEKPDLVSVVPRWTDQHFAMGLAALEAGAHVYMEKPITQTLAEADELLRVAETKEKQIAVAHQMRLAPNILSLKQRMAAGWLGDLFEIVWHGNPLVRAAACPMRRRAWRGRINVSLMIGWPLSRNTAIQFAAGKPQ